MASKPASTSYHSLEALMCRESGAPGFSRKLGGWCAAWLTALVVTATSLAGAQSADTGHIDAYLQAIKQTDVTSRLSALERFAAGVPASSLRSDALTWIVWDERQTHNDAASVTWAEELLKSDPDNALGLAIQA